MLRMEKILSTLRKNINTNGIFKLCGACDLFSLAVDQERMSHLYSNVQLNSLNKNIQVCDDSEVLNSDGKMNCKRKSHNDLGRGCTPRSKLPGINN